MDLVEFLRARYDEDEAVIRDGVEAGESNISLLDLVDTDAKRRIVAGIAEADPHGAHITGTFTAWDVLRLLAMPYSDHPSYDEAWRP